MGKRRERPLRRTTRVREERRAILVVTEGTVTEPGYLNGLKKWAGLLSVTVRSVHLKVEGMGRDPQTVVARAADLSRATGGEEYDSVWVVVDVDQHALLPRALATAGEAGIRVAVSNPCFELWLLLHHEDVGGHLDAPRLRELKDRHRLNRKTIPDNFPWSEHPKATGRAERLHPGADDRSKGPNPSTSVHLLVADLLNTGPESARR